MNLMTSRSRGMILAAVVLSAPLTIGALALSDAYETPPEQDPSVVLAGAEQGRGYQVLPPVRGDGFLRIYGLETNVGLEKVAGDGLLKLRLSEIAALNALISLETEQSFVDGLKAAAQRPVDFVESTVTDPLGTAKSTVSGVGRLFGRLSKGVEQVVSGETGSPADFAKALTGQARARRELAIELGVDPYTTYAPLSEKLDQAASVSTAGDLTVGAVMALIPGGMIVSATGTAQSMRNLVVDSTENELSERTTDTLRSSGIPGEIIAEFLSNTHFTAAERAVAAYRLQAMESVEGLDLLANRAAQAQTRDEAYFQLRRIVLLENYHRTIASLSTIRSVSGFPTAVRRDGIAALVMPLDLVAWTATTATAFSSMHEGLSGLPFPPSGVDFVITGDITPMAAERVASFGWDITSNMPMPKGPVK